MKSPGCLFRQRNLFLGYSGLNLIMRRILLIGVLFTAGEAAYQMRFDRDEERREGEIPCQALSLNYNRIADRFGEFTNESKWRV